MALTRSALLGFGGCIKRVFEDHFLCCSAVHFLSFYFSPLELAISCLSCPHLQHLHRLQNVPFRVRSEFIQFGEIALVFHFQNNLMYRFCLGSKKQMGRAHGGLPGSKIRNNVSLARFDTNSRFCQGLM